MLLKVIKMINFKNIPFFLMSLMVLTSCSNKDPQVGSEVEDSTDEPLSAAQLAVDETSVMAGTDITGQIIIKLADGWHTYSDPPGDSGMAPIITFTVPQGWSSELMPLPKAQTFQDEAGTTFGYEDQVAVDFRLKVSQSAASGSTAEMKVRIDYLICNDVCLPQSADLRAVFNIK